MLSESDWNRLEDAIKVGVMGGLREAEPDRRRLAAEESWKAIGQHVKDCPILNTLRQEMKISILKLVLALVGAGLVGGGVGGGVVSSVSVAASSVHAAGRTSTPAVHDTGPRGPQTP